EIELVAREPYAYQELAFEVKGLEMHLRFDVREVPSGTEVSQTVHAEAQGRLGKMAVPVAERITTFLVRHQLEQLKEALETGSGQG
ncbi:MAG: hypothetical protein R3185_04005, partial [Candidatus Thermoplasmatota archaeon]|nr:hypothetical protein [Candidatus Thermoplasmatota archaeon]